MISRSFKNRIVKVKTIMACDYNFKKPYNDQKLTARELFLNVDCIDFERITVCNIHDSVYKVIIPYDPPFSDETQDISMVISFKDARNSQEVKHEITQMLLHGNHLMFDFTDKSEREWLKYEQYIGCVISDEMSKNHPLQEIKEIQVIDLAKNCPKANKRLVFGGAINDLIDKKTFKNKNITKPLYIGFYLPTIPNDTSGTDRYIDIGAIEDFLSDPNRIVSSAVPSIEYIDDEQMQNVNTIHNVLHKIYFNLTAQ